METTSVTRAGGFSEEALREISWSKGEPDWLLQRRLEAWRAYEAMPVPARHEEEWRRTDVSMLEMDRVAPFAEPAGRAGRLEELPERLRASLNAEVGHSGLLVQHNSLGVYRELAADPAAKGVIVADLDAAAREHPDLVRRHLAALVPAGEGKFATLHAAFWSGGSFVYVPRNVEVELPVHAFTFADRAGLGVMPHTLVVVERGASLVFVDEFASPEGEDPALANGVVEISLGEGARLHYLSLQRWGSRTFALGAQRASVARDARLTTLSVVLGSKMTKSWVESLLREPGASAQMVGVMFAGGAQRFHHHTLQDHQAPHTTSDLLFKVALAGRARSEYSGLIRVREGARGADAYQANRNLLLSPDARADSMPKLEILNNDVRCTHGATVGPMDEEQVFYLMTRGLPRADAERMIVEGFFEPAIERIPLDAVRDRVRAAVDTKLAGGAR